MIFCLAAVASSANGTVAHRSALDDDPCSDPFWTSLITACSDRFTNGGQCAWDAWECDVFAKGGDAFAVSCIGIRERCAVEVALLASEVLCRGGTCLTVGAVLIQVGAGCAAVMIVIGVTLAVVCFCCRKFDAKVGAAPAAQREFGEPAPVTPFGPLPYLPDNDGEPGERSQEEALSLPVSSDPPLSNPYDTPTV